MSDTLSPAMTAALAAINAGHDTVTAIRDEAQLAPRATPGVIKGLVTRGLVIRTDDGRILPADAHVEDVPADLDDAIAAAKARREAGKALEITPSGKVAKMVRITLDLRITTDGEWAVAKNGEGDTAWTLFNLSDSGAQARGQYPTCTAALRVVDGVLSPAPKVGE